MLALGDALALEVSRRRGWKAEDFADLRFIKELDDSGYIDKLYKR